MSTRYLCLNIVVDNKIERRFVWIEGKSSWIMRNTRPNGDRGQRQGYRIKPVEFINTLTLLIKILGEALSETINHKNLYSGNYEYLDKRPKVLDTPTMDVTIHTGTIRLDDYPHSEQGNQIKVNGLFGWRLCNSRKDAEYVLVMDELQRLYEAGSLPYHIEKE